MADVAQSIEAIFAEAIRQSGGEQRAAFLGGACGNDALLRARVDALLKAHDAAGSFMAPTADATLDAAANVDGFPSPRPPRPVWENPLAEKPGAVIGQYKLLQQIGEGSFGIVWMADQEKPVRRRVALKIIKMGMDTKEVIARFEQERQALAMMDHPNIARVLDAGATQTGRPYFVMELVRGVKITQYCDDQGLSTTERIELFITVCQAVQHAHQKGIIHRDLKPSNILVTINDGEAVPKVIDFGVAKATQGRITDGTLFTQFEQMIGTPLYMSPEQAEITSLDVDTRSDIYSLGVLLYELLTGRTPIDTATMAKAGMDEVRRLIREVDPPRPSARLKSLDGNELTSMAKRRHTDSTKLSGGLRGDIDWIVMKCLEKDRKRRYDTANGLAVDLQRHLRNDVVMARPPTTAYLLSKLIRRNTLAFAAGTAIAVSLVIGIGASVWQAVRARSAEKTAVAAFDELRATAPAFAEQARALAAREQFTEAIEKLDYALKLRPDAAEYLLAKADLLQCQLKLAEAAVIYRQALRVKPGLARAESSAKLCDELLAAKPNAEGRLARESLATLSLAMQQQQRPAVELMPVARLLGEEKKLVVEYWLGRLKDLPVSSEKPLAKRLTVRDDGRLALDLAGTKVNDLTPLAGAPLAALDLSNSKELTDLSSLRGIDLIELDISVTSVTDLAPLREMHTLEKLKMYSSKVSDLAALGALRLKSLNFGGCPVSDLNPIRKMPLEELNLSFTRVADLSPIMGMPIKMINLDMTPVVDFSPLAQLPLEKCYLQSSRITDLAILRGGSLKELVLAGSMNARNYAVLSEIKTLEVLLLPTTYRDLPAEDYAAIGALRDQPKLRLLGAEYMAGMDHSAATGSKEVFWQDWDREQTFVPALRKSGIPFTLTKLSAGTYSLWIQDQSLRDLSILKGAPISELYLHDCSVADLTPIRDMKIEVLSLSSDSLADLSPLHGMPLRELYLSGSKIGDLTPLRGLPLRELYLDGCPNVTDVAVLTDIPTLVKLTVPTQAGNIEALRKLTRLQMLAFNNIGNTRRPDSTVDEFWKEYHQKWRMALHNAGMKYTASRNSAGQWSVTINAKEFRDCTIFKGAPIRELILNGTSVADLRPLEELPLAVLEVKETRVTDLAPLRAPVLSGSLRRVNVSFLNATDFSPLAACENLEVLLAFSSRGLSDLTFLRGLKLREVWLAHTAVSDISVLAGMPLSKVFLDDTAVTDVSPLGKCPQLSELVLPHNAREVETLRALPILKKISYEYNFVKEVNDTALEFWRDYDGQGWVRALRDTGIKAQNLKRLHDGTWDVDLGGSDISDLTVLQGAPISSLRLRNTAVANLTPLRGMALKLVSLFHTQVTDLGALKGMPIEYLTLHGTKVADISALRGMPLKSLTLHECTELTDLSPLAECRELKEITLPPNAKNVECLRTLPKLERIDFVKDLNNDRFPDKSPAEFWKEYDAKKK